MQVEEDVFVLQEVKGVGMGFGVMFINPFTAMTPFKNDPKSAKLESLKLFCLLLCTGM